MANTPYVVTDVALTVLAPNAQVGQSATDGVGFYGTTPIAQQSVTASGVTAAQILTALAALGIVKSV